MTTVQTDELDRLSLPPASRARLVFAARGTARAVLEELNERAVASGGRFRLVAVRYDRPPPVRSLIDDVIDRLAALALAMFPGWYGEDVWFEAVDAGLADFEAVPADRLGRRDLLVRGVSTVWLKGARSRCRRGELPRPPGFPASVHAAQLALAIDPSPLLIAVLIDAGSDDAPPADESLLGLARASEWLAREAGARVLLVVPESSSSSTALDAVNFDAVHVCARDARDAPIVAASPSSAAGPRVSVSPLIGRPNPASRGEVLLASRLERDEGLAGLFRYNVRVDTVRGTSPLVDLVWTPGKLVVEVDGFYYHSDETAFARDRRRDYELAVSGYLVLRLPEDEVSADVELAVEKIRDMVAFRRGSGLGVHRKGIDDAT